jgi:hypothetical protein
VPQQGAVQPPPAVTSTRQQKRCLKNVSGILMVTEQAPAQAKYHWTVTAQQVRKRRRIRLRHKALQEHAIGQSARAARIHQLTQVMEEDTLLSVGHKPHAREFAVLP